MIRVTQDCDERHTLLDVQGRGISEDGADVSVAIGDVSLLDSFRLNRGTGKSSLETGEGKENV